jgi:hypothetical protein
VATPTDPSFGAGFDAAAFRAAISSTMEMGLPEDEDKRATFVFPEEKSYAVTDAAGHPFSWSEAPTASTPAREVQIPVAVEFEARPAMSLDTSMGSFDSPRGTVTVLDVHFPEIDRATHMIFDGADYRIEFWLPPVGLFDVTIHQAIITALDEQ